MSGLFHRIQRTVPTLLLLFSLALAAQRRPVSHPSTSSLSSSSSSSPSYALLFFPDLKPSPSTSIPSPSSFKNTPSPLLSSTSSSSSRSKDSSRQGRRHSDVEQKESVSTISDTYDVMAVSANGNRGSSQPVVAESPRSTSDVSMTTRAKFKLTASEKDKKLLDAVERLFLKNAGLSGRPKITDEYAVPEYMMDLYKQQVKQRGGPSTFLNLKGKGLIEANTVRSFVHEDIENTRCIPPLCARVHFDVSSVTPTETLAAAELRIFIDTKEVQKATSSSSSRRAGPADAAVSKKASRLPGNTNFRLEVHEIMRPASRDGDVISRLLDTRSLSLRHNSTWQSFDIHPALVRWKRGSEHNHGLEIKLVSNAPTLSTDNHIRVRRSAEMPTTQWALQRPILVAFTNDGLTSDTASNSPKTRLRRMKRNSNKKRRNRRKNRKKRRKKKKLRRTKHGHKSMCRVHKLYVDFYDVGWDDWVVAPPGYKANYCDGECMSPLPIHTKATNHAVLQARVYKNKEGSVPKVCCVPIKMSSTSMLYRDEKGKTVLKNYQDMTVERCGCK